MEVADTYTGATGRIAIAFRYYHVPHAKNGEIRGKGYQGFAVAIFPAAGGACEEWYDVSDTEAGQADKLAYVDWSDSSAVAQLMVAGPKAALIRASDKSILWSESLPTRFLELSPFIKRDEMGDWREASPKVYRKTLQVILMGGRRPHR